MTDDRTDTPRRRGRRTLAIAAGSGIAVLAVLAGGLYLAAPAERTITPVTTTVTEAAPAPDAPRPVPMARPDGSYHMYVAYFEEHQVGITMNQDATQAAKLAADDAKKTGLSLVVTCHGEDAIAGNPDASAQNFSRARFQTIRDELVAQGLEAHRVKSDWGDPAMTAASAKDAPKSRADRPICTIETAVPTALE